MSEARAVAGVSDHAGWAVVVCVANGEVLDRRRIELIAPGLPNLPHHHEAQGLPMAEAVALVERVRASAALYARNALAALPASVAAIAIRKRPTLPPTVAERITNYRAQCVADSAMYRDVLAEAAQARGWSVVEYGAKTVLQEAAETLRLDDISERLHEIGKALGPPWRKDHRLATSAAIVAPKRITEADHRTRSPQLTAAADRQRPRRDQPAQ
jgi:hypothetical protein